MTYYWESPEFQTEVEAMVQIMKESAGLCSASYFHNQYGWNSGVGTDEIGNDEGYYWLASSLVAHGYEIKNPDRWTQSEDSNN